MLDREGPALERVLEGARQGNGQALVLRGESGFGKSTLLDHAVSIASGLRNSYREKVHENPADLPGKEGKKT